jgi:hypothetical protein
VTRRQQVLKLGHDTIGAHAGVHNTKQRIRMSFFWPTLARDVKSYVASLHAKRVRCVGERPVMTMCRLYLSNVRKRALIIGSASSRTNFPESEGRVQLLFRGV